jgi:hypothetical protein
MLSLGGRSARAKGRHRHRVAEPVYVQDRRVVTQVAADRERALALRAHVGEVHRRPAVALPAWSGRSFRGGCPLPMITLASLQNFALNQRLIFGARVQAARLPPGTRPALP